MPASENPPSSALPFPPPGTSARSPPRLALHRLAVILLVAVVSAISLHRLPSTVVLTNAEVSGSASFKVAIEANWSTDEWSETLELIAHHSTDAFAAVLPHVATAADIQDVVSIAVRHGLPFESADLVKLGVTLREGAPRVQALNSATAATHLPSVPVDCEVFFVAVDTMLTCDLDDLKSYLNEKNHGMNTPLVRNLDKHLIGPHHSRQAIILFAHPRHPSFPSIWKSVTSLQTRIALRYLSLPRAQAQSPDRFSTILLRGFHAHLQIKNTEYKVVDDREQAKQFIPAPGPPLLKLEEAQLDHLANKVIQNVTTLDELARLSQDYPLTLPSVASTVQLNTTRAHQLNLFEQALSRVAGEAPIVVSINGQIIPWKRSSTFNLLAFLRHEHQLLSKAREHLLEWDALVEFAKNSIGQSNNGIDRFDYCSLGSVPSSVPTKGPDTPALPVLVWLNDLEKDARYAAWPKQLYQLLMSQGLPRIARNILNAVFFLDLSNPAHLQIAAELNQFLQQGVAVRFGIVPWVSDDISSDASSKGVRFIQHARQHGPTFALHQLTVKQSSHPSHEETVVDSVPVHARLLSARMQFDIKPAGAMLLNGRYFDLSPELYHDVLGDTLQQEVNDIRQAVFYGAGDFTEETEMGQQPCTGAWKTRPSFVFSTNFPNEFADPLFIAEPAQAVGELGAEGGIMPFVHVGLQGKLSDSQVKAIVAASRRLGFSLDPVSETPIPGPAALIINGRVFRGVPRSLSASAVEMLVRREAKLRILPLYKAAAQKAQSRGKGAEELNHQTFWRLSALWWWNKVQVERLLPHVNSQRLDVDEVVPCSPSTCLILPAREGKRSLFDFLVILHPISEHAQVIAPLLSMLHKSLSHTSVTIAWRTTKIEKTPNRFTRFVGSSQDHAVFGSVPPVLFTLALETAASWAVSSTKSELDLDNLFITTSQEANSATFHLDSLLVEGYAKEPAHGVPPRGMQLVLSPHHQNSGNSTSTVVMANLGYFQLKATPGVWQLGLRKGTRTEEVYSPVNKHVVVDSLLGSIVSLDAKKRPAMEGESVIEQGNAMDVSSTVGQVKLLFSKVSSMLLGRRTERVHVFSVASGHLYERFLTIMMQSVLANTEKPVTFWLLGDFLSPSFKAFLPQLAEEFKFDYQLLSYSWPEWLREQTDKQRKIWAYKILFLDVLFPLENGPDRIIFVDADQIVRADLSELMAMDLNGAVWAYTPFCDNRKDIEGFRFWKQGYWLNHLRGKPYHISALYVVDLDLFRRRAAGDILREQYQMLSADPNSLANLDQDLPNHLQHLLEIYSLPQDWLWCETWCSDESLKTAKTIDLCNNPMTREPKLDRARRLLPEWQVYDDRAESLRGKWLAKGTSAQETAVVHEEF